MLNYRFGAALSIFFAFTAACDDESKEKVERKRPLPVYVMGPVAKAIESVLNQIPGSCEKGASSHPLCETVAVSFERKQPSKRSEGKRILVIDDGMRRAAFGRYKSRVMRYLTFSEEGVLTDTSEVKHFYAGAFQIYDFLDKEHPEATPSDLGGINGLFREKFGQAIQPGDFKDTTLHGQIIFAKLAELNPDSEFWIIDDLSVANAGWELFCSDKAATSGLEFFKSQFHKKAEEVKTLIKENNISFANFSFSDSLGDWRERAEWCVSHSGYRPSDEVLEAYHEAQIEYFTKPLYTLPNFVVVQAVMNNVDFTNPTVRENWRVDCTKFPNALKVAGSKLLDPVDPKGQDAQAFSNSLNLKTVACADVVVNLGAFLLDDSDDEAIIRYSNDGIQNLMISEPSSSYAAPVALSYLIHLKQECPECSPEDLLNRVRRPGPVLIDPIRNKQFDVHRKGDKCSE